MNRRYSNAEQKERIRQRVRVQIDEENYQFFPERKDPDYYDNDVNQRVGVYVRVSTDDPRQTTSYELQKKYYEDFVIRHPKWTLVDIYADEGISGTSTKHRDEFNRMIAECKAGKIDLVITKSVSRFARNVVDFLGMVRMLSERNPPIGVFFEAENIFSLNETSNMALSFQATMAEEESRNKSRSMETSLRMRLDHGLPLTPKLLGFSHDSEGKLIPNPDTMHIPKLMFYMYLYGYSTQQIADALTALEKKTYLGNVKWSSAGVAATLRNERYCGDVYTRKTFTKDVLSHKSVKNRGERPISHYYSEHEGIISRDDFIAVQHMLKNAKYGNKSILPELRVITEGMLKGFVIINPRWSGFKEQEYLRASASAYPPGEYDQQSDGLSFEVEAGDFDMRGFEIAHTDLFDVQQTPHVTFFDDTIKFSTECIRRMKAEFHVELLIHPTKRKFAVRAADKQNRNAVVWAKMRDGRKESRSIACAAYADTIYSLFGWKREHKYRMFSTLLSNGEEEVFIFSADEAAAYIQSEKIPNHDASEAFIEPVTKSGDHVMGSPACYTDAFGNDYYIEQTYSALANQTREQWQIRVEGQLCNTGMQLNVTDYDTLRNFIMDELGDWKPQEDERNEQQ